MMVADASSSKYCGLHDESRTGTRGGPTERRGGGVPARVVAGGADRVGAENPVTLCDLGILADQAAEPVPPYNPDACA